MTTDKQKLAELTAKARELSTKEDPSEDEQKDLDETMIAAKALMKRVQTSAQIDEFTVSISEDVEPEKRPHKDVFMGRDGRFGVFADHAGFAGAVKAWQSGKQASDWGFDVRYKDNPFTSGDPSNAGFDEATSEFGSSAGVLRGQAEGQEYAGHIAPFFYPGIIEPPTRTPVISDLFAQGSTDSNLVRLVRETVTVNNAQGVLEGRPYGVSKIEVGPVDYPVKDIATLLPVTENMLMDIPAMSSYLGSRLAKFVQLAEEEELLVGDATGVHLQGITNVAGRTLHAQGADNIASAILKLMSKTYQASFLDPTWVLMSPVSWAAYATARNDAGAGAGTGDYLGGPPSLAAVRSVWGLPITVSPLVPDDRIFVGNPSAAMIFRNGGLRVESSTGFATYFGEGLVAIRGKVRTAFAVVRPQAIGELILGS